MISEKVEGWEATLIWSGHPNKLRLLPKHSFCSRMYWHLRHFRKTHFVHNAGFIHSTVLPTSLNTFPYYLLHHCPFLHTSELRCSMLPHTFFLLLHISLSKKISSPSNVLTCVSAWFGSTLWQKRHTPPGFIHFQMMNTVLQLFCLRVFLIKKGIFKSQELQSHPKLWMG